ncbi:MAG TPA: hypothetical protein VHR66_07620 [Gemmataceae bacterium]|nr:hypothetical protein [Gemmataceae bacterium]
MSASHLAPVLSAILAPVAFAGPIVLEPVAIKDPQINNLEAVTFLKPKGWKVTGGVQWYPDLTNLACLEIKVSNPDSLEQIETFPWCYGCWFSNPVVPMTKGTNYMGSIVRPVIEHPHDVVEELTLPNLRAKYRPKITGYQDMPEVAKAHSASMGGAKVKAGRVRIEYAIDGQAVEEDIYLAVFVTSANLGVNNCIAYTWGPVSTPFALRAAKGKLDAATPLMLASVHSAQIQPKWFGQYMYVSDLYQNRMAQGIANAKKISDTITRNSDEIFKMYSDAYWSRQKSQDRVHQQFSDYIRGVARYDTPHEKYPVQLPSGYKNAWSSASGEYILSDEAGFDPNTGGTRSWTQLKMAK